MLSDAQWAKIEPLCAGKVTDAGRSAKGNRLFIEAMLWIIRTGNPWRVCLKNSVSGTVCSNAIADGSRLSALP